MGVVGDGRRRGLFFVYRRRVHKKEAMEGDKLNPMAMRSIFFLFCALLCGFVGLTGDHEKETTCMCSFFAHKTKRRRAHSDARRGFAVVSPRQSKGNAQIRRAHESIVHTTTPSRVRSGAGGLGNVDSGAACGWAIQSNPKRRRACETAI